MLNGYVPDTMYDMPKGILSGIRVLELGTWMAVPFAASLLSDFGAEVIKIEPPGELDGARTLGGLEEGDPERSAFYAGFARNKKSITLDLHLARGRQIFLDLVGRSDVVGEAFRPGTLELWGLGPERLLEVNRGLILYRISGFGQTGPYRDHPGFDRVVQAFAGLTYVTGHPDRPPTRAGYAVADYATGMLCAFAVALALYERRSSGRGQVIDQALYGTLLAMTQDMPSRYVRYGEVRERMGNYFPGTAPGDTFQTKDERWIHISTTGYVMFQRLMRAMDRADLAVDPRFATIDGRAENNEVVRPLIVEWIGARTADEAQRELNEAKVACSPIMGIDQIMAHPQVKARGDFVELEDDFFGQVPATAVQPRFSRTPGSIRSAGPRLGQHNQEVYGGLLGLSETDLVDLHQQAVI